MANIEIPFEVGETVWWVGHKHHDEWVICPECNGDKSLTLIKGNGEQVSLDCNFCQLGYDPPKGKVKFNVTEHEPTAVVLGSISMSGGELYYVSGSSGSGTIYKPEDIFENEDECKKRCEELNRADEKNEEKRLQTKLTSSRRTLAHSSHYWTRQIKRLEKELERTRAYVERKKEMSHAATDSEEG